MKLLGTNVVADPATSKELVIFTVQLQQILGKPPAAGEHQPPAESAKTAKTSKTARPSKAKTGDSAPALRAKGAR